MANNKRSKSKGSGEGFRTFIIYTAAFVLMSAAVFLVFLLKKRGFNWKYDGFNQHFPALAYYGQWLREAARTIFVEHRFSVPVWNFSMGYGSDIITTLQYYCLGDPLCLLSAAVPMRYTEYLYHFLVLLRFYLAGGAFLLFCRRFKLRRDVSVVGAMMYIFCGYALLSGVRHPYFLTPMIYFPLILLGTEKVFAKESPALFILSVFLMTISNFYFAYMGILLTIVYAVVRFFDFEHSKIFKDIAASGLKFLLFGLIGLMMAAVILMPVICVYLNNDRAQVANHISALYPAFYYEQLYGGLLGYNVIGGSALHGPMTITGYSALSLIGVFYMFSKHGKYRTLKILFALGLAFQLFPFFGHVLNGFSYVTNRHIWSFAMLLAFIAAFTFEDLLKAESKDRCRLLICMAVYVPTALILQKNHQFSNVIQLVIAAALTALVVWGSCIFKREKTVRYGMQLLCLCSVIAISADCFFPTQSDYVSQFLSLGTTYSKTRCNASTAFERELKDAPTFCRYEKGGETRPNQSLLNDTFGISYFWSYSGNHIADFIREIELNSQTPYYYQDLNGRAFPELLASVRYYIGKEDAQAPYNFRLADEREYGNAEYRLYENPAALPLGYCYESILTREEYEKLSALQRQEAIMQCVLLEADLPEYPKNTFETTSFEVPFESVCDENIRTGNGGIYVMKAGAAIQLNFDGKADCETYITVSDLHGKHLDDYELNPVENHSFADCRAHHFKNEMTRLDIGVQGQQYTGKIPLSTSDYSFYSGIHDFTVNLGYSETPQQSVTLTFPVSGFYRWQDMKIICQPMQNYGRCVSRLSKNTLTDVQIGVNCVSGIVSNLEADRLLCLSIPHSSGWSAFVDGKETEILRANSWCMALNLKEGTHNILLKYMTPGLRTGAVLSLLGTAAFAAVLIARRRIQQTK